jgi:hypothetical protein
MNNAIGLFRAFLSVAIMVLGIVLIAVSQWGGWIVLSYGLAYVLLGCLLASGALNGASKTSA